MLIKMQGKKLKDIYKREVNYGDYVLFNFSYCDELYNKAIGLYTDKGIYISDLLNLDSLFSSLPSTVCYKIENPLDLGLDLSDVNSLITLYYLKDLNYYSDIIDKPIVDIFGRRLGLGDFVIYKTVGYKFHYGIVIDDKHVFTSKLIKERATIVYKVITSTELELEIYNNLKLEYQKLQNLLIIGNFETKDRFKNLKKGDCFRKNNNFYIYMGEYYFHALWCMKLASNYSPLNLISDDTYLTKDVLDLKDNYVKFYLCLNMKHNKTKEFLKKLKENTLNQEEFEQYVVSCGLHYGTHVNDIGLSRIFKFNLTERRLGSFVENLDVSKFNLSFRYYSYNPKYSYLYYILDKNK